MTKTETGQPLVLIPEERDDLGFVDKTNLIHAAAEDIEPSQSGDGFDLCFMSPPYFRKEIYSDESHAIVS